MDDPSKLNHCSYVRARHAVPLFFTCKPAGGFDVINHRTKHSGTIPCMRQHDRALHSKWKPVRQVYNDQSTDESSDPFSLILSDGGNRDVGHAGVGALPARLKYDRP